MEIYSIGKFLEQILVPRRHIHTKNMKIILIYKECENFFLLHP